MGVDKTTLQETLRSPDGSESIRLATPGANWQTPLNSLFLLLGSQRVQRAVTSSPIAVGTLDQEINIYIGTGSPTCPLPSAATRNGMPLTFKDAGGNAVNNPITITAFGSETIDGDPSFVLSVNYEAVTLVPITDGVGSGWMVL